MALRRCPPSAFQRSLKLTLGLVGIFFIAEWLLPKPSQALSAAPDTLAQATNAQAPDEIERKRLATALQARFADPTEAAQEEHARSYQAALRQACALPRLPFSWQFSGPGEVTAAADFCNAAQTAWAQWLAQGGRSGAIASVQRRFSNGAMSNSAAGAIWWASANEQGLWRGTALGWEQVSPEATDLVLTSNLAPQTVYVLRKGWQLETSQDGGVSFSLTTPQLAEAEDTERLPVAPLALNPANAEQLWTGGQALWRSQTGGSQWERVTEPIAGTTSNRVTALAVAATPATSAVDTQTVLVGTREGWLQRFAFAENKLITSDAALPQRGFVSALAFAPQSDRLVYAAYATFGAAHVWQSTDGGLTWRALDGAGATALPDIPVNALAADPQVPGRLFAGTDAGVFVTDSLATEPAWSFVGPSAWITSLQSVAGAAGKPELYAFANSQDGAGLWRTTLEAAAATDTPKQPAQAQCAHSIYPTMLIVAAEGETKTIAVQASSLCEWAAVPEANAETWISVVGPTSNRGDGNATLKFDVNAPYAPRFGSVKIGGQTLLVAQQGSANSCRPLPITPGQPINGQLSADDCLKSVSCCANGLNFTYADRYTFSAKAGELIAVLAQSLATVNYAQVAYNVLGPDGLPVPINNLNNNSTGEVLSPLPQTGTYTLEVFSSPAQQMLPYRLTLQLLSAGCDSVSATALDRFFGSAGGTGRLMVSTASNCSWQVITNASWLTPTSTNGSGNGSQTVTFNVAENTSTAMRTAYLEVGGRQTIITQAGRGGACGPQPLEPNQSVTSSLSSADCTTRIGESDQSVNQQYVFNGRAGQRVSVEVALRPDRLLRLSLFNARGDLLIQGDRRLPQFTPERFTLPEDGSYILGLASYNTPLTYTLLLNLQPADCTYMVTPERQTLPASASLATLQLQTAAHCPWQLTPMAYADWLPLEQGLSGVGPRTLAFSIPANRSGSRRYATLALGGQQIQLTQAGPDGTCNTSAITPDQATPGSFTQGDCPAQFVAQPSSDPAQQLPGDRFSFNANASEVFSFTVTAPTSTPNLPLPYLPPIGYALLDPQGKLILAGQTDPNLPPPSIILPGTGKYVFELAPAQVGQFFNYSLTVQVSAAGCTTHLTASATRFEAAGGEGVLQIDAPPNCRWQIQPVTAPNQFRLEAAPEGSGRGQVRFSFGPNTIATATTAILRLGQQYIYLAQAGSGGSCQAQPLPFDQFVNGQISRSDCPLAQKWNASFSDVVRGDRYTFNGTAGEQIALTGLRKVEDATQITTRQTLKLYAPDGQLLTGNVSVRSLGGKYLLPASGSYAVEVTPTDSYGNTAYQLLLERLTAGCIYAAGLSFQRFDSLGGNGSINLSTDNQCRWTPRSNALWVRLLNPPDNAAFTGATTGSFTVEANASTKARLATIVAGGEALEIEQAGSAGQCSIQPLVPNRTVNGTLSASDCRARFGGEAMADLYQFTAHVNERFRFDFNTTPNGVPLRLYILDAEWRLVTQVPPLTQPFTHFTLPPGTYYLQVTGDNATGVLPYTLTANVIGGQCSYTVLQNEPRFFMPGGAGSFTVLTGEGCPWTAAVTSQPFQGPNWLTLTSSGRSVGSGTVSYQVQPFELLNNWRQGALDIAEQRLTITQISTKAPESCEVPELSFGQTVSGTLTLLDCTDLSDLWGSSRADRFSFTARAGQQFAVEVNSAAPLNLRLYDATQRVVAIAVGARLPSNSDRNTPRYLVLPEEQTYFLEISYPNAAQPLNYTVRLVPPATCAFNLVQTVPAQNQPLPAAGGNGVVQVFTPPGCAWSARASSEPFPAWLTLTGATSGTGPGTITFSVAPNETNRFRSGWAIGYTVLPFFNIGQLGQGGQCGARAITSGETVRGAFKPGDCANSVLKPEGLNAQNSGLLAIHSFTFNATRGDQFAWRLRVPPNQGTVQLMIFDPLGQAVPYAGYPPPARVTLPATGTYTLELAGYLNSDYEFVLDLTAPTCGFTLESEQAQISGAGGSGTINVQTQSDCTWAASSADEWITLTSQRGKGNGTISFTVAPNDANDDTRTRLGSIQLAGRSIPVVQAGRDGSCAPVPISAGQTLSGAITPRDCLRVNANNLLTAQLVDRYLFTARAGEHAQVKVVSNGALGVQIIPFSALGLNSAPLGNPPPGQPTDWFGSASLTIPADGTYVIEVMPSINGPYLGAYTVHLQVNAPGCGVVLSQTERQFANAAAQGSFAVTTAPACRWQIYAVNEWITLNGARDRNGSATITYDLTANTSANARWGTLIVGGQIFVIEQAGTGGASGVPGSCTTVPIAAGQTLFGNLSSADCRAQPSELGLAVADRYSLSGTAGQRIQIVARLAEASLPVLRLFDANGNQLLAFTDGTSPLPLHARLPATTDFFTLPQTGAYIIEVALRQTYGSPQFTQSNYALSLVSAAPGCSYSVAANPLRFDAAGGTGTINVVTDSLCPWHATVGDAWISSPATLQTGSGTVTFTVQPNTSALARRSFLLIGGRLCVIEQAGVNGTCLARPILAGQTLTGTLDEQDCPGVPLPQQDRPSSALPPYAERFTFTAQGNERVFITAAVSYTGANPVTSSLLKLTGPDGVQLLRSSNGRLPASNDRFVLPMAGTYEIEFSAPQKLSYALTLFSQANECFIGLSQQRLLVEAPGGTSSLHITTSASCAWQAVSDTPWLSFANQAKRVSGTGNGTLTVIAASNPSAQTRSAAISIGDNLVMVEQAGSGGRCAPRALVRNQLINGKWDNSDCGGYVPPANGICCTVRYEDRYGFTATAGERLSFTLQTSSRAPRLELYDPQRQLLHAVYGSRLPSGAGEFILPTTGNYQLVVAESVYNDQPASTYTLLAADNTACAINVTPNPLVITGAGGKIKLAVTASQPSCTWSARSATSWLRLPGETATQFFTGSQELELALGANWGSPRLGFVWLADQLITIQQGLRQLVPVNEPLLCVNAATFAAGSLAPDTLVSAFGTHLALDTRTATTWQYNVADTIVTVTDQQQVTHYANVLFVSPTQVNFVLPANLTPGPVTVAITSADGYVTSCTLQIAPIAPGLFSANASGSGLASGLLLRTKADQSQSYEPLARFDPAQNRFIAVPAAVDVPGETVHLLLFGTGLRGRSSLAAITARIGNLPLEVSYCGPVHSLLGLDQLNLALPAALAGSGNVQVEVTIEGKPANALRFNVR